MQLTFDLLVLQECTKAILLKEFERGKEIVVASPVKSDCTLDFGLLSQPVNFFGSFANYLQVIAAASSNEDFGKWSGYLNARVKHFVSKLHNTQGSLQARPWPKEFPIPMCASVHTSMFLPTPQGNRDTADGWNVCREHCEDGRQRTSWVIGVKKQAQAHNTAAKRIDIRATIADFKTKCEHWTGHTAGMTLEIKHLKFDSLPPYLAAHAQAAAERAASKVPAIASTQDGVAAHAGTGSASPTPPARDAGGSFAEADDTSEPVSADGSAASSPVGGKRKRDGGEEREGVQRKEHIPQPHVEMAAT